jgi:hypothetical protein
MKTSNSITRFSFDYTDVDTENPKIEQDGGTDFGEGDLNAAEAV